MGDVGRDPRVDPRPGDELEIMHSTSVLHAHVSRVEDARVWSQVRFRDGTYPPATEGSLNQWRAWAKSAAVVKKGEPE